MTQRSASKVKNRLLGLWGLVLLCTLPLSMVQASQLQPSTGKDFFFTYEDNGGDSSALTVYVSSVQGATGEMDVPGFGIHQSFSVPAGSVATLTLPSAVAEVPDNAVSNYGIHISTDQDVSVHGMSREVYSADGFLVLPSRLLGSHYITANYQPLTRYHYVSQFAVISTQDNTQVTITPSVDARGHPANQPFSVTLDQGQTFQVSSSGDLTGSDVTGSNPVAVMSGDNCADVPVNVAACDYLAEMMAPLQDWGTSFLALPSAIRSADLFRVIASEDGTHVTVNGQEMAVLGKGQFYDMFSGSPKVIETSKPASVMQDFTSYNYDYRNGDPSMMTVVPTGQFLSSYLFATPQFYGYDSGYDNFINVVIPTNAITSLKLDGSPVSSSLFAAIGTSGYSGAKLPVQVGTHSIEADEPFGLYIYGFSYSESYGYPGGMALNPINAANSYQNVQVVAQIATAGVDINQASFATPPSQIQTFPGYSQLTWNFPSFTQNQLSDLGFDVTVHNPVPGEVRPVIQQVTLNYTDTTGAARQQTLGPQSVTVLPSIFSTQVATDRTTYSADQTVTLTGSVANLSAGTATVTPHFTVVDAHGNLVADLGTEPAVTLAAGQSLSLPSVTWLTGSTYQGTYTAELQVTDSTGQPAGQATAPFQIVAADVAQVAAQVTTDQVSYAPNNTATLTARISNPAPNALLTGDSATLTVTAPDNTVFWTQTFAVPQLAPQGMTSPTYSLPLTTAKPGVYPVTLQVTDASGAVQATAITHFTVESTAVTGAGLAGSLALSGSLLRTEPVTLTAQVTNAGNADLANLPLTLSIVDPATKQVVATWSTTLATLAMGANSNVQDTWVAMAPVGATYAAVLTATVGGTQRILATKPFVIGNKLPASFALGKAQGRLLVLMDDPSGGQCSAVQELDLSFLPSEPLLPGDALTVQLYAANGTLLDSQSLTMGDGLANTTPGNGADVSILSATAGQLALSVAATDPTTGLQGQYHVTVEHWQDGVLTQHDSGLLNSACGQLTAGTTQGAFQVATVLAAGSDLAGVNEYRALRTLLTAQGMTYTITTTATAFAQAFATSGYNEFGLFMVQVKLPEDLQQSVVTAVNQGAGLLYGGFHDQRNGRLEPALGITVDGKLPHTTGLTWPASALQTQTGELDFSSTDMPLKASLQGATPVATYLPDGGSAITTYTYGTGHGIYMGFDVLAELAATGQQGAAASWLASSLTYLAPTPTATTGHLVPVQLTLTDQGTPTAGQVVVTLPTGVTLIDAGGAYQATDGTLLEPFQLAHGQTLTWTAWVILPTTAGTVTFNGEISIVNPQGQSVDYGPVTWALPVTAPASP